MAETQERQTRRLEAHGDRAPPGRRLRGGGDSDDASPRGMADTTVTWSWGDNRFGRFGDGSIDNNPTPKRVSGLTGIAAVSAGGFNTMVLQR